MARQTSAAAAARFAPARRLRVVKTAWRYNRQQILHRQRRITRQQTPTVREAADIRQADVEDGDIWRLMRRRLQRGQTAAKDADLEALLLQHVNQGISDTLFILN